MLVAGARTLSSFPFIYNPTLKPQAPKFPIICAYSVCKPDYQRERSIEFVTGESFFRHESATGRDLGVLAASLYKNTTGQLRVLDALCGCGIRSLRYLIEAQADFVLANDANDEIRKVITDNLSRVPRGSRDKRRWLVTHFEANRVLTECYLQRDFFDLIDIDSFGSDSSFLRSAMNAVKLDGLLYVTSTDGYSSGGHRPYHSLSAYGAFVRSMPYSNEVGLRMLIGGAVREASVLGYRVTPLFSYYSYHGPVFRVMLRVSRGKLTNSRYYGFISYCKECGNSQAFSWDELGQISCSCSNSKVGKQLLDCIISNGFQQFIGNPVAIPFPKPCLLDTVWQDEMNDPWDSYSGPLWTGPLHDANYLTEMLHLAEEWDWVGRATETALEKLLKQMMDESDPKLPFGFIKLDEVASRAKINSPPLRTIISTMQKEGYTASRSHIASNAIKTDCPMEACIRIAKELKECCGIEN